VEIRLLEKFDFAIIGGGILGVAVSYWLSSLYDARVCVVEKEGGVAEHASSRNTGVVHSPFYLDPQKKGTIARAALISRDLWRELATRRGVPWKECGTIEVALDSEQHKTLEKYAKWGAQNGIPESQMDLLDARAVSEKESNIKCHSGLYCSRDVSTDYGMLTRELSKMSEECGTVLLLNSNVSQIMSTANGGVLMGVGGTSHIECKFVINCAGGRSLDIAKKLMLGMDYSVLHFRGEYWVAEPNCADLVNTNVYSVAKFPNFPFLDPHWIKKANGQTEIGPNAVPVFGAEEYSGYIGNVPKTLSKLREMLSGNTRNLLLNPEFLSLVSKEWKSSLSKDSMVGRLKEFIPKIRPSFFTKRGTAGIRSPVIRNGKFVSEILELQGPNSLHVVNYNSPGATGAPAYAAYLVKKMQEGGILNYRAKSKPSFWNYDKIIEKM